MNQHSLSRDSHVVLLLASHLGSTSDEDNGGLGPAGWHDFATQIDDSTLDSPGDLLRHDPEAWPDDIWTTEATRTWVAKRLRQSATLAAKLEDLNNRDIWVTTRYESSYPERVRETLNRKAPPFFYIAGDAENLRTKAVGFVGSRDADDDDKKHTRKLVEKVSNDGFGVVSGGAKGIDETSAAAGLEAGVAVVEFPTEGIQHCLAETETRDAVLAGNLALVSHYHPTASWNVGAAMGRNKLIHSFANYTVVVRSGYKTGGTWEGATENLDHHWSPLFVCTHEKTPDGNQALLDNGGIPINPTAIPDGEPFEKWALADDATSYRTNRRESGFSPQNNTEDTEIPDDTETGEWDNHQSSFDQFG